MPTITRRMLALVRTRQLVELLALALSMLSVAPAGASVLCTKKSGVVVLRAACKKKETALGLAQFGALGPKGDKGDKGDPGNAGAPGLPGVGPLTMCPPDAALVGTTCVDSYEASVWQIPPSNTALVQKVRAGAATLADLTGGGATQLSPARSCSPAYPANFPASGQWTPLLGSSPPSPGVYAVSIPGVHPSGCITWFQAAQACRLSGKRLLTNLEWQDAAAGTPDPGTDNGTSDCNISAAGDVVNTGSRSNCNSNWGVFDLVGNVSEWVADWADQNNKGCTDSTSAFGFTGTGDFVCFGGDGSPKVPGVLYRGGGWGNGTRAGVFAVGADFDPSGSLDAIGFRCAR